MRWVGLVMALLVAATVQSLSAAVQYEFRQTTHSDLESTPPMDMTGRGVIDGDRSRVDFISGTGYAAGSYIISTNGLRTMTFVNPMKRTYVDVNGASVAAAIGSARIAISNKKVNLTQLEDHPVIAGLPTDHYRLTFSYDITLAFGTIPLEQHVNEVIDKWVTQALGDIAETFLASGGIHTGNPDLDDLISVENTRIKGFALKQTMSVTTTNDHQPEQTKLTMRRSVTQTRELTLTSVEPKPSVPSDTFTVPATFHKPDPLNDDSRRAPLQILTLQPSGGK